MGINLGLLRMGADSDSDGDKKAERRVDNRQWEEANHPNPKQAWWLSTTLIDLILLGGGLVVKDEHGRPEVDHSQQATPSDHS